LPKTGDNRNAYAAYKGQTRGNIARGSAVDASSTPGKAAPADIGARAAPAGSAGESNGAIYEPSFKSFAASAAAVTEAGAALDASSSAGIVSVNRGRADDIAEALAEVLEQEAMLYQDAADIAVKKTDIIVHGKIEELDSLVKAEQAIIMKIGRLEDEREKIVGALSDELDLDLDSVTLSDINGLLGSQSYARLGECQKSLARTLGGLKNSNDMNAQLIQNALDYVNFSVNLLTTNQDSGNMYTQDGADGVGQQRRSIFDVKL